MAFVYRNPISITPVGAIVRVSNILTDPSAVEGGWSGQGGRAYSVSIRVETNSPFVGPIQVIQSLNLRMGDYYQFPMDEFGTDAPPAVGTEKDQGSFIQSVRARRESEDAKQWVVTMDFSPRDLINELGGEQIADGAFNPLQRRPEVSISTAKYQVFKAKDLDDKPFITTAGEPLQDPPPYDENRPILTIVMNRESFDPLWVNRFKDSVNFDEFLGFPPNKVKCRDITGDQVYEPDWPLFWKVKYEFEIKDDSDLEDVGWTAVIQNRGYRERFTPGATPTEVIIGGKPVSEPVLINEAGKYVADADPYYLEFHVLNETNFAELEIPEDVLTRTT